MSVCVCVCVCVGVSVCVSVGEEWWLMCLDILLSIAILVFIVGCFTQPSLI